MDRQTERLAKKEGCDSSRNSNTVCWQCWSPRYNVPLLLPCGGCHPEGLIFASLIKLKVKLQKLFVKASKRKNNKSKREGY